MTHPVLYLLGFEIFSLPLKIFFSIFREFSVSSIYNSPFLTFDRKEHNGFQKSIEDEE